MRSRQEPTGLRLLTFGPLAVHPAWLPEGVDTGLLAEIVAPVRVSARDLMDQATSGEC